MCIFSAHSVIRDPPFSRLDLISCRNFLIYLKPDVAGPDHSGISLFAASREAFCFSASSENSPAHIELFVRLDRKNRIFRRRDLVARPPLPLRQLLPSARHAASGTDARQDGFQAGYCSAPIYCDGSTAPSSSVSRRPT